MFSRRGTLAALSVSRGLANHKSITPEAQARVYWTMVRVHSERSSQMRSRASIDTIVEWIRIHADASMSVFGRCGFHA
jgi:hypothetical protein